MTLNRPLYPVEVRGLRGDITQAEAAALFHKPSYWWGKREAGITRMTAREASLFLTRLKGEIDESQVFQA